MSQVSGSPLRWESYFFQKGNGFHDFWGQYLSTKRNVLFIAGLGFDPRAFLAYKALTEKKGEGRRDCFLVEFDEGPSSPSKRYQSWIDENRLQLESSIPRGSEKIGKRIDMLAADGRRIGSRNAAGVFTSIAELSNYDDIVIDVSAMPRSIYFPLIGKILFLLDTNRAKSSKTTNLHVVVAENAKLDSMIKDEGIDENASYIHGFTGSLDTEGTSGIPKVWIPILGEGQSPQMERIYELVQPNEVSPVLPMPSVNPRRGDDLLIEYRELLFDRGWVEQGNFVYASEQNPFEVYRQVFQTASHYNEALQSLGGCQSVISALSSKLLSIGALLVAYELKNQYPGVGIAHVETHGYNVDDKIDREKELENTELASLWLVGDCYE